MFNLRSKATFRCYFHLFVLHFLSLYLSSFFFFLLHPILFSFFFFFAYLVRQITHTGFKNLTPILTASNSLSFIFSFRTNFSYRGSNCLAISAETSPHSCRADYPSNPVMWFWRYPLYSPSITNTTLR